MQDRREVRVISFKIDTETLLKLDILARGKRKYRSEVIREAIERYLEASS